MDLSKVKFDDKGLVPVVVQDFFTKQVLTLAYMNRESLEITLAEKRTCFYSRSRGCLWRKGESSGNTQRLVRLYLDCDGDALTAEVIKAGPACHTGAESCFFEKLFDDAAQQDFDIGTLYDMILGRKQTMPEGSYTTYLFAKGREKILKKVGEECTEVVIGAMKDSREETVYEISDLAYHVLVLMVQMNISVADIVGELASRHVIDKKVKQETMK